MYLFGGHLPSRSPLQTERLLCLSTFGFFTCTTSPQPPSPRLRNLTRMLRKTTSSWHLPWASPEGRVRTPRYCLGVSLGCTFRSCGGGCFWDSLQGRGEPPGDTRVSPGAPSGPQDACMGVPPKGPVPRGLAKTSKSLWDLAFHGGQLQAPPWNSLCYPPHFPWAQPPKDTPACVQLADCV